MTIPDDDPVATHRIFLTARCSQYLEGGIRDPQFRARVEAVREAAQMLLDVMDTPPTAPSTGQSAARRSDDRP